MLLKKEDFRKKKILFTIVVFTTVAFTACGQRQGEKIIDLAEIGSSVSAEQATVGKTGDDPILEGNGTGASQGAVSGRTGATADQSSGQSGRTGTTAGIQTGTVTENSGKTPEEAAVRAEYIIELFGDSCIADQTFEVELSAYDGKVWFVPYAPSGDNQDFHIQIVKDNEVLEEITAYVPDILARKKFSSLDAVAFYDINYDDITDILLIETYGDTTFAAVYYGYKGDFRSYFLLEDQLSENISNNVETMTVPAIRGFLSDGKKNGEFSDYREAYQAVGRLYEMEGSNERKYDLIYIDDDDIPELVAAVNGYYVSLYTYSNGKVYTLMDQWGYGAMGNSGYAYVPERNSLRNYNTDYAGAILYTTYMEVSQQKAIEISVEIKTCNFDDTNGNGIPDEGDIQDSFGKYSVSYINGEEVTEEEWNCYDKGEYEYIEGQMSLDQLLEKLKAH